MHLPQLLAVVKSVHRLAWLTSWHHDHHITSWCHTIGQGLVSVKSNQKPLEITFFDLVTVTFDLWPWLALWTCSRYQGQSLCKIWWPCVKRFSRECANRHTDIQKQTETDNRVLCTITVRVDNQHAKLSCTPPNQYQAMLCTTKVYVCTELHCAQRWSVAGRWCTT